MLRRSKLLFAALAAAATTLALVANASANNLSVREKNFEVLFNRPDLIFEAAGDDIECPLTLLGLFNENTIAKVLNSNIGLIHHAEPTRAGEPPCTGGTYTLLTETLPWRLTYQGFTGRLPAIERLRVLLVGVAFRISTSGTICLAGTTTRSPAAAEAILDSTTGRITGFRADESVAIPLGGGFICSLAGSSHLIGDGTILNLPATAGDFVTLI